MPEKVVLAYSGGLDTSIIIPWLKEHYSYDVIAMVGDVGQGDDLRGGSRESLQDRRTAKSSSKTCAKNFSPATSPRLYKPGAVYEHDICWERRSRGRFREAQVEIALDEGDTAVAHGCTGKGNDQVRFELGYQALAPELKVIAPWREWDLKSREDVSTMPRLMALPWRSREKIHSRDRNLWHISHEGGELEDAGNAPLDTTWQISRSPKEAPDREEQVEIGFEAGIPMSVNGMKLDPAGSSSCSTKSADATLSAASTSWRTAS